MIHRWDAANLRFFVPLASTNPLRFGESWRGSPNLRFLGVATTRNPLGVAT